MGLPFMPWQQLVADVALELDEDGGFAFDEVDITVPRQSGKTVLVKVKTFWRLIAVARTHGRQRSTYTAQTRLAARKKLESDFAASLRDSSSFSEVAHNRVRPSRQTQWRLTMNNGSENIEFGNGSVLQIDAPSRAGGHGDTLDDGTIDEAWAHHDDEVEASMRPAQATRRDAQLWVPSTAGDVESSYLYRKVLAGRRACESRAHGRVAFFEWSAPDDADPSDPRVWRSCSPALGHTISEAFLASEWERAQRKGQEGVDTFRRSYLNQWPEVPMLDELEKQSVIPLAAWEDCADPDSGIAGQQVFALEVAEDRSWSCFAAAGASSGEATVHGEIVDYQPGTAWTVARAKELIDRWGGELAISKGSPAASLIPELEIVGVPVRELSTTEHAQACGQLLTRVIEGRFEHRDEPALNVSVRGAAKRDLGDAWVWFRRKSTVDISPLVAVTLAAFASGSADDGEVNLW